MDSIEKQITELVNQKDSEGFPPLLKAAIKGDLELVKKLISLNADPNGANNDGFIPLVSAAASGYSDIAEHLIENGANVNYRRETGNGATALHLAVENGHKDIAIKLADSGADVNAITWSFHNSILHYAAIRGELETIKMLVTKGANVSAKNSKCQTPLDLAVERKRPQEIIDFLKKVTPSATDEALVLIDELIASLTKLKNILQK